MPALIGRIVLLLAAERGTQHGIDQTVVLGHVYFGGLLGYVLVELFVDWVGEIILACVVRVQSVMSRWLLLVERVDFVEKTLFVVGFVESVDEIGDI